MAANTLYTIPEVARQLGISEGCVRVMISRNRLKPTVWKGDDGARRHLFNRKAIETYRETFSRTAPRTCPHCHGPVPPRTTSRVYCCRECQRAVGVRAARGLPADHPGPADGERFMRQPSDCDWCGQTFGAARWDQRFCSTHCRVLAFHDRHGTTAHYYRLERRRMTATPTT